MNSSKPSAQKRAIFQRKSIWAVLIVVLLAGGGAAWYFLIGPGKVEAQVAAQSTTTNNTSTVRRGSIEISASGSGTLVASQSVDLAFSTGGKVSELNVKVGDTVKAGKVLARLDSANDLEAKVAAAQLALIQARQALTTLQENADVALAQSYQDLLTAQDTYTTALTASQKTVGRRCSQDVTARYKSALDRATTLLANVHAESAGSAAYISAKGEYDTALANYTYCASYTADEKTSADAAAAVAKNTLQKTQDQYNTLKSASGIDPNALALDEARVKEAETQLAQAQDNLTGIVLTAPMDGKVVSLAAGKGAIVGTTKYITIAEVDKPTINVSLDETDMDKLVVGSAATVTFDALQDQTFTGTVIQADPQLTTSGQYRVAKGLVQLDDKSAETIKNLPLGLTATVTIISKQSQNTLLVPVSALKDLGSGEYAVMVVGTAGTMKLQTVSVGLKDTTSAEITNGLKEGDVVSTGTTKAATTNSSSSSSSSSKGNTSAPAGEPIPGGMPPAP